MCGRGVRGCAGVMGAKTHFLPRSIWRGTSGRAGDMVVWGRQDSRDLQDSAACRDLEGDARRRIVKF